jgi:glutamine cyclotransferase
LRARTLIFAPTMRAFFLGLLLTSVLFQPGAAASCPPAKTLSFHLVRQVHRSQPGFTEGLEWHNGAVWESTGDLFGESRINRIDPATGQVTSLVNAGKDYFGEGLTFFGEHIYQMTWREHRVFVFDDLFQHEPELSNPREGWGLTHDSKDLIASDGSDTLFFLSPRDFSVRREVKVTVNGRPLPALNELEWVNGAIWANVFEDWNLVRISPASGCVEAVVDLRPLLNHMKPGERRAVLAEANFVPNGIAHDPASGLFIVTGKYWPALFFGRISGPN